MKKFHKFWWCEICQEERICAVEGEISEPANPFAIGPGPAPDVIKAKAAWCEEGHELDLSAAQEMLEEVARGEVI